MSNGNVKIVVDSLLNFDEESTRLLSMFCEFCVRSMSLFGKYSCLLVSDKQAHGIKTTAVCLYDEKTVKVSCDGRMFSDILRSIAHELFHLKQYENGMDIPITYLHFSSEIEDDANAVAGKLLNAFSGVIGHESIYSKGIKKV